MQQQRQTAPLTQMPTPLWRAGACKERVAAHRATEGTWRAHAPATREAGVPRCREHRDVLYGEEVDECPRTPGRQTTNRTCRQAEVYELRHHQRQRGRLGAFPLLITQNAVVIVANTDRLIPKEGLVEVLVTEVIGVHDLGLKRLLVADNDALCLVGDPRAPAAQMANEGVEPNHNSNGERGRRLPTR
jgi:hypothetical protein